MGYLIFGTTVLLILLGIYAKIMADEIGWDGAFKVFGVTLVIFLVCMLAALTLSLGLTQVFGV